MEEIRQWAYGITSAAIIGAIILALAPNGSTEKLLRTAVSLFLMCSILFPFISNANPLKIFTEIKLPDSISVDESSHKAEEYIKNELVKKIYDILAQNGINEPEISIDITIENSNEMKINSASIFASAVQADKFDSAEKALKDELGIEVKIEVKQ